MNIKNRFKSLIKFLNYTFQYPQTYKEELADKNIKNINFIVAFLFFTIVYGYYSAMKNVIPGSYRQYYLKFYYISFLSLDILSFISSYIVRVKKIKSLWIKQLVANTIPVGFILLFCCSIFLSSENIIVYFIFFTIIVLLSVLFLDLNIFVFLSMIISGLICLCIRISAIKIQMNPMNVYLYGLVILFVSLIKQYAIVRNLRQEELIMQQKEQLSEQNEELERQKEQLMNRKKMLEAEVLEQTEAIRKKNDKLIEMQDYMINALSNLIENRDEDTGNHVSRTSMYVYMLTKRALEFKLYTDTIDEKFLYNIRKAAPLHDMGKITISDVLLKKPTFLTEEEFLIMQKHTVEGGRIVKEILKGIEDEDYIQMAYDVALYHHERFDGSGYPYKLKGYEIPVSARIMAIADVFDALVSVRCYKQALRFDEALQIISDGAGKQFDPFLAEAFLSMRKELAVCIENEKVKMSR